MRHRIKRKIKKNQQNNFTLEIQKQAAEKLQQLVNENYTEEDVDIKINYDICLSKSETSLLMENI